MTLNISQPHLITKITLGLNKYVKSLMIFHTQATPHKGILRNQETYTNILNDIQKRCGGGVGSLL